MKKIGIPAKKEEEYLTGDEELRRIEDLKEKWEFDYNSAIYTANTRGIAEGMSKGLSEGMSKGLSEGMSKGLSEGMSKGLSEGMSKGMIKGIKIEKKNIAKKMLESDLDIDLVVKVTGLSKKQLKHIF